MIEIICNKGGKQVIVKFEEGGNCVILYEKPLHQTNEVECKLSAVGNVLKSIFSEERINEEDEVASLKAKLKKANAELARYRRENNRRYRYEDDYLPYEDDDRRGD